jgi:seryl-tRNA synthetase
MNIDYIVGNKQEYVDMMVKRFKDSSVITKLEELRKIYVDNLVEVEQLSRAHNDCSKLISRIKKAGKVEEDDDNILTEMFTFSSTEFDHNDVELVISLIKNRIGKIQGEKERYQKLVSEDLERVKQTVNEIPNLLDPSVPVSVNENDNTVVFQTSAVLDVKPIGQFKLCEDLGIYESATKIAGNRGYFLVGDGVRLNSALQSYALDFMMDRNYKVMATPFFMNRDAMKLVCQLSEFDETLYTVKDSKDVKDGKESTDVDKYLIATSEQPLTAYFDGKKLNDLPVKLAGISSCFRKEAGKHGVDTNGIFRVHQFEKVEQFCVTDQNSSYEMMEEMLQNAKDFYDSLGISYRVVSIVSGALNNAASKKYDIEGWFPGSNQFRELVSCSNTTDYFSRRLNCKNKKGELVHMLNSTLYANTRTICCMLETYQTEHGVKIPDVLIPYMMGKDFIPFKNIEK